MPAQRRYVTQAEFARLFNVSETEIVRAWQSGRITRAKRGGRYMIDLKTEAARFASTAKHITTRTPSPAILAGVATADGEPVSPVFDAFTSKAEVEKYKALRAKLDYEKELGELVPLSEVQSQWVNVAILVRKAVMNVPDRLSPMLAAEDDARRCWAMLDQECRTILEDLANELGGE
jgi:hypothetical protein